MTTPFDALGLLQQGQSNVGQQMIRGSMTPGYVVQGNPSPAGTPVGRPMNKLGYGHQNHNGGMPGQPAPYHSSGMPHQSPIGPPQGHSSELPSRSSIDLDAKARLQRTQQRLLLMHHSTKCPHEDGRCTATPYCADMKLLWRHMMACENKSCRLPHCVASSAMLDHYRRCKDVNCPACGPVRKAIQKNSSRTNQQIVTKVRSRL